MASPAAQRYFNSFPPGQQAQIMASWGGADLMDQWFQNAVNAGAVSGDGQRPVSEGATGPTASTGNWTAQQLRDYAGQQGWSEDFARFNDATLQGWINDYWDPQAMKFRSMRGAEGYFEKPTECPPGMMPGGPNESDGCIGPGGQTAPKGGGGAGSGSSAFGGAYNSPLRDMLANQGSFLGQYDPTRGDGVAGVRGGVMGGGGIWWQPTDQARGANTPTGSNTGGIMGGQGAGPNVGPTTRTPSLTQTLAPLQGQQAPSFMASAQPVASSLQASLTGGMTGGTGTGTIGRLPGAPQSPLTGMLAKRQKPVGGAVRWF